jgi:hypothetical protein
MSSNSITIKPNNHRIYQCPTDKKIELINKLISENSPADIVVVCSGDALALKEKLENQEIRVLEDKELVTDREFSCETLISYDLPIKAIIYMARVSKATDKAFMLLDQGEQKELYQVEMLLGRAIKQEKTPGFEYVVVPVEEKPYTGRKMTPVEITAEARKRYESKTQDAPKRDYDKPKREFDKPKKDFDKPKRDFKPKSDKPSDGKWDKQKKAPNKFLGKDENGKAQFSGKSGERNHRHDGSARDVNAPAKVGRKINIKAIKPKETPSDK